MHAIQMLHELRSTIADARAAGDLPGHLRAWLQTVTTPDDSPRANNHPELVEGPNTITPGANVTIHTIPGLVLYPVHNVEGYWSVAQHGKLNHSVHERDMVVI